MEHQGSHVSILKQMKFLPFCKTSYHLTTAQDHMTTAQDLATLL